MSRFGADYSSSSAVSNKSAFGDRHRGAHSEIGIHRGMNGVRILPPSMTLGTSASSPLHYGGPSDPIHRVGVGEDMNSENDERLIYQAALQVTQSSFMYGLQQLGCSSLFACRVPCTTFTVFWLL